MKANEDYSKAVEFVKKYGWESANLAVKRLLPMTEGMPVFDYGSEDLKRLVESHEYIENFGGLDKANRLSGLACFLTVADCKEHNKHIENVESCK